MVIATVIPEIIMIDQEAPLSCLLCPPCFSSTFTDKHKDSYSSLSELNTVIFVKGSSYCLIAISWSHPIYL